MTHASNYTIRDRDLEAILALGAPAPLLIGGGNPRGPAAMFSCNRRGNVWAPDRRGYTDPERRKLLDGRSPDLDRIARRVRRHRWKGGRFTIRPNGVYIPADAGGIERILEFIITITPRPTARRTRTAIQPRARKPVRQASSRKTNQRRPCPSLPAYKIAESPEVRLCVFCFSADLDESGCRACGRGNGGYGLKW